MILKLIRMVLGALLLTGNALFPARPRVRRSAQEKATLQPDLSRLKLYEFRACPFCLKVRRGLRRMDLDIERRDALRNERYAAELVQGGGELQVPCLRIEDAPGQVQWLYESAEILAYLEKRFSLSTRSA